MRGINKLFLFIFFSLVLLLIFQTLKIKPLNPDTYWHLSSGREIVKNKGLPQIDDFSYTGPNKWYSHEWLFDVLIYLVSKLTKLDKLYFFNFLLWIIILFELFLIVKSRVNFSNLPLFLPFLVIIIYLLMPYISLRPQVFTFIFMLYFVFVLEKEPIKKNSFYYFSLPFIAFVWVNFHAATAVGIFLIFWYLLFYLIRNIKFGDSISEYNIWLMLIALLGVAVASFLSPLGFNVFFIFSGEEINFLKKTITEWQMAWSMENINNFVYFGFFYFYASIFFIILFYNFATEKFSGKPVLALYLILNLVFFVFAILFRRNMPFFLLFSFLALVYSINSEYNRQIASGNDIKTKIIFPAILILLISIFIIHLVMLYNYSEKKFYPETAIKYIYENKPSLNIFSDMQWSGFFEYYLYPEYRVMISGRLNQSREAMQDYVDIYIGANNFFEKIKKHNINTFLLGYDSDIVKKLLKAGYVLIYFDDVVMILTKKTDNLKYIKHIFPWDNENFYDKNNNEKSLSELKDLINKYPSEKSVFMYAYILSVKQKEEAILFMEKCLTGYKNYHSLYNLLGAIYFENKDYHKAFNILKKSRKRNRYINNLINESKKGLNYAGTGVK